MLVQEIVGRRMREFRESRGMTQDQLGEAIGELLGKKWSRQAVSAAEHGDRAFTAVELVAIARAMNAYVGHLFSPAMNVSESEIELSPGVVLDTQKVMEAMFEGMDITLSRESLNALLHHARVINGSAGAIELHTKLLLDSMAGLKKIDIKREEERMPASDQQPVVAAIVTSDLGVLVGKRNDGKPPWTFIAGEQDAVKDENPADTAVREVKEETGLRIQAGELIGERVHPKTGRTMIYMAATPTHGTEIFVNDEDELAEVRWVSLAEADELLPGMFGPVREHLARELGGAGDR